MTAFIIIAVVVVLAVWFIATFNRFIRLQNLVREAWSGIDVQLKRRHDLIPNIVETVKGYSGYERQVFEQVTAMRGGQLISTDLRERGEAENTLTQAVKSLFAVAEAYPDLKANTQYLTLERTLTDIEEQIQYARRYYNGTVRNFNILVQSFPSNILAGMFHYQPKEYFEIELATQREAPEVRV